MTHTAGRTKTDTVLAYLQAGNHLTPLTALTLCGTMRLSALIYNLKKQGHVIHTEVKRDRFTGGVYAEYSYGA